MANPRRGQDVGARLLQLHAEPDDEGIVVYFYAGNDPASVAEQVAGIISRLGVTLEGS